MRPPPACHSGRSRQFAKSSPGIALTLQVYPADTIVQMQLDASSCRDGLPRGIAALLAIDVAASGWLWLLWNERHPKVAASHPGESAASHERPGRESPATVLQQRAR